MNYILKRKNPALASILVFISNLNIVQSASSDPELNIKDVCVLSEERFPDQDHSVADILHSYDVCLHSLDKYPTTTRESLLKQLVDKLECFKDDLKQSYYAGNLKYEDLALVENMENDIRSKGFRHGKLQVNHINCNVPRAVRSTVKHIVPLAVTGTLLEKKKACEAIFKQDKVVGQNFTEKEIQTPSLDSNKDPKELIVPLASPSTYKVDSPEAEEALTTYYKVVMKCLTLTTEHKIQVFRFNKRFYDWLSEAVLPHLKDDKCYPAFGGVLRIVETMRQNDFVPKNATANFIFYRQKDLGKEEEERRKQGEYPSKVLQFTYFPLIIWPIIIFIFMIIMYIVWITRCRCCPSDDETTSSDTEIFYYPIEDSCSVSLVMDDVSSDTGHTTENESQKANRERGGADSYSVYQQENTILSLPLKRLLSGKNLKYTELSSPGKRQKKN